MKTVIEIHNNQIWRINDCGVPTQLINVKCNPDTQGLGNTIEEQAERLYLAFLTVVFPILLPHFATVKFTEVEAVI